jgi:alpha-glucosidase
VTATHWWQDAVVYQVYVRSFADADGDGIGDLEGLRRGLGHIASLGVDAIWLCPIYPSPQRDHGYDVADYVDIEPAYGDLATFDRLVADARDLGIRVLLDVVPNHCSDQHPGFQAALRATPGSDERARFWFRPGRDGGPPNNWPAAFGGSVWTPVGGDDPDWYLGTFTPYQPDFDHRHPAVDAMFADVLRFWFDRGVDGFRVDAVWPIGKHPDLPDSPPLGPGEFNPYTRFVPEGHDVWRRWRTVVDRYMRDHPDRDLMLVAEAYTPKRPDILAQYTRPDEFHQCFAFDLLLAPWHGESMRTAIAEAFAIGAAQGTWPTLTLNNHDTQRTVTRYGRESNTVPEAWTGDNQHYSPGPVDLAVGTRRARAAAGLLLAMPGAIYLYMGEELGLPEVLDLPDEARQDPVFFRTGGAQIGRDGARVPMPWTHAAADAFGFSPPGTPAPAWMPPPADWGTYAIERQDADPDSVLALYRRLIAARREHLGSAGAELLDEHHDLVAIRRGDVVVACNVGRRPARCVAATGLVPLLTTGAEPDHDVVAPDTAVWFAPPDT